jgi:CheY-like chemotaxis protein/nitrogen-specific signal transduction histidine kinase
MVTSPFYSAEGELQGFTGVIRDISRRVQQQRELEKAKRAALEASKSKSEFLANMSHEIRTPMNGVLGILQLLKETQLDASQKKYIETALASGYSLLGIISDILDFSKIEAGKGQLTPAPVAVRPIFRSAIDSFASMIDADRVEVAVTVAGNVPEIIVTDEWRLKQILYNLIGNAVKFTAYGTIAIDLRLAALKSGNRAILECVVRDTGIGVNEQMIERLFEPFVQEDGSFRRKVGGTGLGLSIVKNLVELMGGKVRLESSLGLGTSVVFTINVAIGTRTPETESQSARSSAEPSQINVLVVEDEAINAMVISAMLSKLGHQVEVVDNGRSALKKLAAKSYDCIFMDIQMPEMDGMETTRIIRSDTSATYCAVPIVALTAHAMKGDREKFLAAGMNDYLAKPIEVHLLTAVLDRLLSAAKGR